MDSIYPRQNSEISYACDMDGDRKDYRVRVCGASFGTSHASICPTGGLPTIRHNEIRDLLANILTEVCTDVAIEPPIPSATNSDGEDNGKRLDIRARGFGGGRMETAFLISGCLTPLRSPPSRPLCLNCVTTMKTKRGESMSSSCRIYIFYIYI